MAASTPTKSVAIDCFLCFTKNATCFKLSGRKAIKENFQEKLNNIIGHTYQHELMRRDAMVCMELLFSCYQC